MHLTSGYCFRILVRAKSTVRPKSCATPFHAFQVIATDAFQSKLLQKSLKVVERMSTQNTLLEVALDFKVRLKFVLPSTVRHVVVQERPCVILHQRITLES